MRTDQSKEEGGRSVAYASTCSSDDIPSFTSALTGVNGRFVVKEKKKGPRWDGSSRDIKYSRTLNRPTLSSYSLHLAVFENAPRLVAFETRNPFSVRTNICHRRRSTKSKAGVKGWKSRSRFLPSISKQPKFSYLHACFKMHAPPLKCWNVPSWHSNFTGSLSPRGVIFFNENKNDLAGTRETDLLP